MQFASDNEQYIALKIEQIKQTIENKTAIKIKNRYKKSIEYTSLTKDKLELEAYRHLYGELLWSRESRCEIFSQYE